MMALSDSICWDGLREHQPADYAFLFTRSDPRFARWSKLLKSGKGLFQEAFRREDFDLAGRLAAMLYRFKKKCDAAAVRDMPRFNYRAESRQ